MVLTGLPCACAALFAHALCLACGRPCVVWRLVPLVRVPRGGATRLSPQPSALVTLAHALRGFALQACRAGFRGHACGRCRVARQVLQGGLGRQELKMLGASCARQLSGTMGSDCAFSSDCVKFSAGHWLVASRAVHGVAWPDCLPSHLPALACCARPTIVWPALDFPCFPSVSLWLLLLRLLASALVALWLD